MAKPSYEYSGVCYVATAGQTTFALTTTGGNAIDYLKPEHIKVRTSDDAGNTWNSLVLDTDWVFADPATSITLNTGATEDSWIDIYRETPVTRDYIEFQDGDLLTAGQLNDFDDWQLFIDQEIADRVGNLTAPDINLVDTDDLPEGSVNLYYTDARVEAWIDSNLSDTDDLTEGTTNLYYTDARVESYVSGAGYIKDAGVTKLVAGSNIVLDPSSGVGEVTINSSGGGGSGVVYKGTVDATNPAPVATSGDLWVNTATSGVVGSGWTGIVGDSLSGYERLLYDGTNWSLIPSPSGFTPTLQEVTAEGNDTTKDITLNTDKIVLTASSGAATLAGGAAEITELGGSKWSSTVQFAFASDDNDTYISAGGDLIIQRNSSQNNVIKIIEGTTTKVSFDSDGSAVIKGDVAIGENTTLLNVLGDAIALLPASITEQFETIISSLPAAQPFTGDPETLPADIPTPLKDALVRVTTGGKINLNADTGSATFAGSVSANRADGSTSDGFSVRSGTKKRFGVNAGAILQLSDDIANDTTVGVELNGTTGSAVFQGKIQMAGLRIDELTAITSTSP